MLTTILTSLAKLFNAPKSGKRMVKQTRLQIEALEQRALLSVSPMQNPVNQFNTAYQVAGRDAQIAQYDVAHHNLPGAIAAESQGNQAQSTAESLAQQIEKCSWMTGPYTAYWYGVGSNDFQAAANIQIVPSTPQVNTGNAFTSVSMQPGTISGDTMNGVVKAVQSPSVGHALNSAAQAGSQIAQAAGNYYGQQAVGTFG